MRHLFSSALGNLFICNLYFNKNNLTSTFLMKAWKIRPKLKLVIQYFVYINDKIHSTFYIQVGGEIGKAGLNSLMRPTFWKIDQINFFSVFFNIIQLIFEMNQIWIFSSICIDGATLLLCVSRIPRKLGDRQMDRQTDRHGDNISVFPTKKAVKIVPTSSAKTKEYKEHFFSFPTCDNSL